MAPGAAPAPRTTQTGPRPSGRGPALRWSAVRHAPAVAPRDGRRRDDQDGGDDDRHDPARPVDAGRAVAAERPVDDESEQDPCDPAEQRQPQRDVVLVAWGDQLAEQPDDEPSNENSDDLHE